MTPPMERAITPPPTDVTAPIPRPALPAPEHGIETKKVRPPSGEGVGAETMPLAKTGTPPAPAPTRAGLLARLFKRIFG